jgi:RNA polymerase sigma factor (sigma-70 family)
LEFRSNGRTARELSFFRAIYDLVCYLLASVTITFIEMSETELLQAFRKERSEEAFAELVRRYAGLVYSVAKRRLANATQAEDITQIVFIRLAKALPKVQSHGELVAWLHRTTINVAIDTWRSETRRRAREQQAVVMEPAINAVWEEISPRLDEALNQLNDQDRQAVLLRFFGRKTMRDVGAALGVSEDAAKMRVSRAVDRLRTQLGVGGVACTAAMLGTMLTEYSVEAAPNQLISRLAAMRLPAVVGATGMAGLFGLFLRASTWKLAVGAVLLALIAGSAARLLRPARTPVPEVASTSPAAVTGKPTDNPSWGRPDSVAFSSSVAVPPKAVKIMFHLLDAETGTGLGGAKIHLAFFGPGGEGESHEMLTDNNGDFRILEPDDATKNRGPNVFVTAEGHVPKVVGFYGAVPTDYTMRLDRAMTVEGVVVNEQGVPVPEVTILVQGPGDKRGQSENVDFQTCPVTNRDDGSWSCSYIPKDFTNEIRFILKKPGYAVTFPVVPVAQVNLTNLVLVMNRGFTITGQVMDAQGQPVGNADIKILNGDPSKRQSAKTDDFGVFAVLGVPGDADIYHQPPLKTNNAGGVIICGLTGQGQLHADLAVQAQGFAPQTTKVNLVNATNVANFTLSQGNIFRGHIVDETGNPITNAVVRTDFDFKNQVETRFEWTVHTDANGRFEWDSAPKQEICYWFEADGFEVTRGLPLLADGSDHEIVLKGSRAK